MQELRLEIKHETEGSDSKINEYSVEYTNVVVFEVIFLKLCFEKGDETKFEGSEIVNYCFVKISSIV